MADIKKLKLVGSGNEGERSFFILTKGQSFFSLFPIFLIGCGFKDLGIYEYIKENKENISTFHNKVEYFRNENYEIDLIYTNDRIILIVRTDINNRKNLIEGIKKIAEF